MQTVKEKSVRQLKRTVALILIASIASGCTTLRPVSSGPKLTTSALRTGDDVQVTMRDGRLVELTVKEISELTISGEKERVEVSDIIRIDRHELNYGKTAGLTAVIAMTAILISGILLIASMYRTGL